MPRVKDWCVTINNPTDEDDSNIQHILDEGKYQYIVWQLEQGEQGTPHYQMFLQMKTDTTDTRIRRLLPRAHVEARFRKSKPEQAAAYCKKEEGRIEGPFEYGVINNAHQGQRTDLEQVLEMCQSQASLSDIAENHTGPWFKYNRAIGTTRNMYIKPRDFKTQVTIIWGWPGAGKTYWALKKFPNAYKMNDYSGTMFFADYDPITHETVVYDDFHGNMKFSQCKQLMDEYAETVQTKGGFQPFRPKHIVFTSNISPTRWWKCLVEEYHWLAFYRRVENIIEVTETEYFVQKGIVPFPFDRVPLNPNPRPITRPTALDAIRFLEQDLQ